MIWRANGPCVKQWEQPLMTGGHIINFNMLALLFFCPQALIIRFLIALAQIALTIPKRTSVFIRSLMNKQKRMILNLWESLKKSTCPNQRLAGHVMESCSPLAQVHINSNSWFSTILLSQPVSRPLRSPWCGWPAWLRPPRLQAATWAPVSAPGSALTSPRCSVTRATQPSGEWRGWWRNWVTKSVSRKWLFDEFKT